METIHDPGPAVHACSRMHTPSAGTQKKAILLSCGSSFPWGSVSAPGILFDPCPTGDLLGGALSAVRAQCNYLDV